MSNLRKALIGAGTGLGIGVGLGALGTYYGIVSGEDNLNNRIDSFGNDIDQVRAELPNVVSSDNSITISGYNKNETPKELLDSIKLSTTDVNGNQKDLKKEVFDYVHNKELLQGLEKHKSDLLKTGAGLGGLVGSSIGLGVVGASNLAKNPPKKPLTEASIIGKFTKNGTHIKIPKQASTFDITNRLKANALKRKELNGLSGNDKDFKISESNPFKVGSVDYNRYQRDSFNK